MRGEGVVGVGVPFLFVVGMYVLGKRLDVDGSVKQARRRLSQKDLFDQERNTRGE